MTRFHRHAPTAGIFGLPAAMRRSKNPWGTGLKRIAVRVGRYSAFRSRAFPDLLSRVRPRTLDPQRKSRGEGWVVGDGRSVFGAHDKLRADGNEEVYRIGLLVSRQNAPTEDERTRPQI